MSMPRIGFRSGFKTSGEWQRTNIDTGRFVAGMDASPRRLPGCCGAIIVYMEETIPLYHGSLGPKMDIDVK